MYWKTRKAAFSILTDCMIVSIATQKGGAGKTTTSIALSAGLARKGKKVLLVDIDQQANSSKVLLHHYPTITKEQSVHATIIERKPLPIHKTDVPNLDIVPGHILLSNTDVELTIAKDRREDRLKRELDKVKDNYDFVFIDCPPNLGWLTINALTASDQVIIIVAPGYFELDSIVQFYKTKEEVQEFFNPTLQLMGIFRLLFQKIPIFGTPILTSWIFSVIIPWQKAHLRMRSLLMKYFYEEEIRHNRSHERATGTICILPY